MPKRRGNGWSRPRKRVVIIKNDPRGPESDAAVALGDTAFDAATATVELAGVPASSDEPAAVPLADVESTDVDAPPPEDALSSLAAVDTAADPFEVEVLAATPPEETVPVSAPVMEEEPAVDCEAAPDAVAATFVPGAPMTDEKMFPFADEASSFRMLDMSRLQEEFWQMFSRNEASWCEFVLVMLRRQGRRLTLTYEQLQRAVARGHREVIQVVRRYFTLKKWAKRLVSC